MKLTLLAARAASTLPSAASSMFIAGCLHHLKHSLQEALRCYVRVATLSPRHAFVWSLLGQLYMELGQTAQAVKAFQQALALNPRDFNSYYHIGLVYELVENPTSSVFYYKKAVEIR